MKPTFESQQEIKPRRTSLPMRVEYMDNGVFRSRLFDVVEPESRATINKILVWAAYQDIEIRIRPAANSAS